MASIRDQMLETSLGAAIHRQSKLLFFSFLLEMPIELSSSYINCIVLLKCSFLIFALLIFALSIHLCQGKIILSFHCIVWIRFYRESFLWGFALKIIYWIKVILYISFRFLMKILMIMVYVVNSEASSNEVSHLVHI